MFDEGIRHDLALAVPAFLLKCGADANTVRHIMGAVVEEFSNEPDGRKKDVEDTITKFEADPADVTGTNTLSTSWIMSYVNRTAPAATWGAHHQQTFSLLLTRIPIYRGGGDARSVGADDEEAATAFRTMFAYTGTVQLDGDRWATKVDVAWNPAWHGTEQVRTFKLDDDRLEVTSAWGMSVNLGKMTRGIVLWERVK